MTVSEAQMRLSSPEMKMLRKIVRRVQSRYDLTRLDLVDTAAGYESVLGDLDAIVYLQTFEDWNQRYALLENFF